MTYDKNEYTQRQKDIINGKISYKDYTLRDCERILERARLRDERDIVEFFEDIQFRKQEDAKIARNKRALDYYYNHKEAVLEKYLDASGNITLSPKEKRLLSFDLWVDDFTMKELLLIKRKVAKLNMEKEMKNMDVIIELKNNPDMFLPKNNDEAIEILQQYSHFPIVFSKRPCHV